MLSTKDLNASQKKRHLRESWPERMSKRELRQYINGCHKMREYDSYFDAAIVEWNNRYR